MRFIATTKQQTDISNTQPNSSNDNWFDNSLLRSKAVNRDKAKLYNISTFLFYTSLGLLIFLSLIRVAFPDAMAALSIPLSMMGIE